MLLVLIHLACVWRAWSLLASVKKLKREERLELVIVDADLDDYTGRLGREKPRSDVKYS